MVVLLLAMILPSSIVRRFHKVAVFWGYVAMLLVLSPPKIYGKVQDKNKPAVITSNHQSPFDIFIALGFYPLDFLFMSKKEVFQIPLMGLAMKKIGYISIDRANPRAAAASVKEAIRRVKEGNRVLIYPEGTRSYDANNMLPFKAGTLKIASEGAIPILPIVVYGTQQIHPMKIKWFLWPHRTALMVLDPIGPEHELHPANEKSKLSDQEKLEKLRQLMAEAYAKLAQGRGRL